MEIRKHYLDFKTQEEKILNTYLNKDKEYKLSNHTIFRQKDKLITSEEIQRTIHNGKIIEFHYKDSNRILVRGNKNEHGYNICAVLDIDNSTVVTAYYNKVNDKHCTLNTCNYSAYVNICGLLA